MINVDNPVSYHRKSGNICKRVLVFILFFLIGSFFIFLNPPEIYCNPDSAAYDTDININAESAVVVNYDTGDILWEKNSSRSLYPASLTKMLSSIIAIENIKDFDEITRISKNASGRNHSSFTFKTGDTISLMDLLKASLISSHNNAIIELAEYLSGNTEDFVSLMNIKAREIGAYNSTFENTNGLDDTFPYHRSTALDLARIASYCMDNDLFREIVSTREDIIKKNNEEIGITNTNTLLKNDYIKGIKTGYTNNAGFCEAIYSDKEDLNLITVVLNSETAEQRDNDVLKLLNWAYNNLEYTKVVDSKTPFISISTGKPTSIDINLYPETDRVYLLNINSDKVDFKNSISENITVPIKKDDFLGTMAVFINDKKLEEINLVSNEDISGDYIYQELSNQDNRQTIITIIFLIVFYFLIFIIIIVKNLLSKRVL